MRILWISYLKRYQVVKEMFYSHIGAEILLPKLAKLVQEQMATTTTMSRPQSLTEVWSDVRVAMEQDDKTQITDEEIHEATVWKSPFCFLMILWSGSGFCKSLHLDFSIICTHFSHCIINAMLPFIIVNMLDKKLLARGSNIMKLCCDACDWWSCLMSEEEEEEQLLMEHDDVRLLANTATNGCVWGCMQWCVCRRQHGEGLGILIKICH